MFTIVYSQCLMCLQPHIPHKTVCINYKWCSMLNRFFSSSSYLTQNTTCPKYKSSWASAPISQRTQFKLWRPIMARDQHTCSCRQSVIFIQFTQTWIFQPDFSKSNPITVLDRPLGFQKVEAHRFLDNRHMKVVRLSALRNSRLYPPGNIPGTHFC
jgi:hypothetical protein